MSEYYIRRKNHVDFEVAKFDNDSCIAMYTVRKEKQGFTCICPKWSKKSTTFCRHTEMVQAFINQGEPSPCCIERE